MGARRATPLREIQSAFVPLGLLARAAPLQAAAWDYARFGQAGASAPPEDALRRRAWSAARRNALGPIERRLDAVSEAARGAARSERAAALWALRWTACLTACERQVDARLASGSEVSGCDLAAAQWDVMLAAARAFEALAQHAGTPPTP